MVQRVLAANGDVLYNAKKVTDRAFSEDTARDATYALEKVVTGGTGSRARVSGREVAGKTGTTQDNRNAWFVGYTATPKEGTTGAVRQLSTAVWLGYPQPKPMRGVAGVPGEVTGGSAPARIFHDYLTAALEGVPTATFRSPVYAGKIKNGPGASSPRPSSAPAPAASASASAQPTGGPSTEPSVPPGPSAPPSPRPSPPPPPVPSDTGPPVPVEPQPSRSSRPAPSGSAGPAAAPGPRASPTAG